MPKMSGREVLSALKDHNDLARIPVVVLTTSQQEVDVARSYDLGANSFIVKPVSFQGLVEVMDTLQRYWFEIVETASNG